MQCHHVVRFDESLFVNRERARQEFVSAVFSAGLPVYLEFHGVAGMGKTELLKWIAANPGREPYVAAYLDFEDAHFYQPGLHPILAAIADQLAEQIDSGLFSGVRALLPEIIERKRALYASRRDAAAADLRELEAPLIQAFLDELRVILAWRKVALCLDSTEKAYRPALNRLEECLLLPFSAQPNFLLVAAGQERVAWNHQEIRHRIRPYPLANFDSKWGRMQVEQLARVKQFPVEDGDAVIERIVNLTVGHPYSTYKLVDMLTDGFTSSLAPHVFEHRLTNCLQQLLDLVVEGRILARTQLGDAYPPARKILWLLAPLRSIELGVFRFVLSACMKQAFEGKPVTFFERLFGAFQTTAILTRWQLDSGFVTDPVARNLLLWDMRVNTPEFFVQLTDMLEKHYGEKVGKTHEATQVKNLIERLYHYATALRVTLPNYVNSQVQEALEESLADYFTLEYAGDDMTLREQFNRLQIALERDDDLSALVYLPDLLRLVAEQKARVLND